jgi:hypothetical protein
MRLHGVAHAAGMDTAFVAPAAAVEKYGQGQALQVREHK